MKLNRDEHVRIDSLSQDSDEWLEWRQKGLGSSDISLIMSPERQFDRDLVTLWRDRTGIEPHPFVENEHTRRGKELEPGIRDAVNAILNSNYQPLCVYREDAPYLRASLDGYDFDTDSILEIKSPSDKVFQKYLEDWKVPDGYMFQMQYQMLVSGASYGWYSFFNDSLNHPKLIYVEPDLKMQSEIERRSHLVWFAIQHRMPIGFVDGELTLLDQRPLLFLCLGESKPPLPVARKSGISHCPDSFWVQVKDPRTMQGIISKHLNHKVIVMGEGGTPFAP